MIFNKRKSKKELGKGKIAMSKQKGIYVLYKGDEQISEETTIDELAKIFKVKKETLYFYQSPAHQKRNKKNFRVLVRVDWLYANITN